MQSNCRISGIYNNAVEISYTDNIHIMDMCMCLDQLSTSDLKYLKHNLLFIDSKSLYIPKINNLLKANKN